MADYINYFQNCLGIIKERRWDSISSEWLRYIDGFEPVIGSFESAPFENVEFLKAAKTVVEEKDTEFECDIPAIRTDIFRDSLLQFSKAIYLLSSAEQNISHGYPTSAIPASYLGSVFATRAILGLMGICYTEVLSKSIIIDFWPRLGKKTAQGATLPWSPGMWVMFAGARIDHQTHWNLFIHTYRQMRGVDRFKNRIELIRKLKKPRYFSERRNGIHYQNGWYYDDIFECLIDQDIGVLRKMGEFSQERMDIDPIVSQILIAFGYELIQSISTKTNLLKKQMKVFESVLNSERHPRTLAGCFKTVFAR